jgi:hypothetical protein
VFFSYSLRQVDNESANVDQPLDQLSNLNLPLPGRPRRSSLMSNTPLSTPMQELNFTFLQTLRDFAREDAPGACCKFGLSRDELSRVSNLNPTEILELVRSMGDEAFFAPRQDLGSLLSTPRGLLPFLAASRPRVPTKLPAFAAAS